MTIEGSTLDEDIRTVTGIEIEIHFEYLKEGLSQCQEFMFGYTSPL